MNIRSQKHLLLPLLALGLALATAAMVPTQSAAATTASLQINFGNAPHWTPVSGTRISVIREAERPDYDIFQYGGRYYVFQGDRWYTSRRQRGQYVFIEERYVPRDFTRIPRGNWRHYPGAWEHRDNGNGNANGHRDQGGPGNGNGRQDGTRGHR